MHPLEFFHETHHGQLHFLNKKFLFTNQSFWNILKFWNFSNLKLYISLNCLKLLRCPLRTHHFQKFQLSLKSLKVSFLVRWPLYQPIRTLEIVKFCEILWDLPKTYFHLKSNAVYNNSAKIWTAGLSRSAVVSLRISILDFDTVWSRTRYHFFFQNRSICCHGNSTPLFALINEIGNTEAVHGERESCRKFN